jgi:hypothetical protein
LYGGISSSPHLPPRKGAIGRYGAVRGLQYLWKNKLSGKGNKNLNFGHEPADKGNMNKKMPFVKPTKVKALNSALNETISMLNCLCKEPGFDPKEAIKANAPDIARMYGIRTGFLIEWAFKEILKPRP